MIYITNYGYKYDIDLSSWNKYTFNATLIEPVLFADITIHLSLPYIQEEIPQFVKDHPEYFI